MALSRQSLGSAPILGTGIVLGGEDLRRQSLAEEEWSRQRRMVLLRRQVEAQESAGLVAGVVRLDFAALTARALASVTDQDVEALLNEDIGAYHRTHQAHQLAVSARKRQERTEAQARGEPPPHKPAGRPKGAYTRRRLACGRSPAQRTRPRCMVCKREAQARATEGWWLGGPTLACCPECRDKV